MSEQVIDKSDSVAGLLFDEPGSATFGLICNNVTTAQILLAGQFLLEFASNRMQKQYSDEMMGVEAKDE